MIPPSMQMKQAMAMQRSMMPQGRPEDPLLQALSHQEMMGEAMKETAKYKAKMLKLKMKHSQPQMGSMGQPPSPQGGY